jgi:hypothetical protein
MSNYFEPDPDLDDDELESTEELDPTPADPKPGFN